MEIYKPLKYAYKSNNVVNFCCSNLCKDIYSYKVVALLKIIIYEIFKSLMKHIFQKIQFVSLKRHRCYFKCPLIYYFIIYNSLNNKGDKIH